VGEKRAEKKGLGGEWGGGGGECGVLGLMGGGGVGGLVLDGVLRPGRIPEMPLEPVSL